MCTNAPSPPIGVRDVTGIASVNASVSWDAAPIDLSLLELLAPATISVQAPSGTLAVCAASATTSFTPALCRRERTASAAKAVNSGTYTAPIRQVPSSTVTRSALLPISVATRSPRPTPSPVRTPANRSERSRSSPYVRSVREPSNSTRVNASDSGWWRSHSSQAASASGAEKTSTNSRRRVSIVESVGMSTPLRGYVFRYEILL